MTLIVDIKQDFALSVLEGLEKIGAIDMKETDVTGNAKKDKIYEAIRINLEGFRFNREEANER
ncbi:hypothetical protein [Dyadobacter bucti]|uniref:hypothetical protein n=1 Tax=Dyadobacter bucti TaxID=2572203 RepID=UPI003F72D8E3